MSDVLTNMHKVVYLANEYKGSKVEQVQKLFPTMPLLNFNTAIWKAVDMEIIVLDKTNKKITKIDMPDAADSWYFGEEVDDLMDTLEYAFKRLAEFQVDLSEHELNNWMQGYQPHDQFVAVKLMLNRGILADYTVTTKATKDIPEGVYTFYTLSKNLFNKWGRKQFKDQSKLK